MSTYHQNSIESHDFATPSFTTTQDRRDSQDSSSTNTTPSQTPTQEISSTIIEASLSPPAQTRGRPRYKRRQPSQRYFTPPSRIPSPVRPDFLLEVESAPQDPDIFADAETDYFSSTDKFEGPRAFRRHFFDAMPSIDSQTAPQQSTSNSIDAQLASR